MSERIGSEPRKVGRPSPASSEAIRQAILEAAVELFAERGYKATSVASVCERAGVRKPSVYWHFGNKHGLLSAALESANVRLQSLIGERLPGSGANRLDALIGEYRQMVLASSPALGLAIAMLTERSDPVIRQTVAEIWHRAEEAIADGIRETVGRDLPDLDLVGHTAVTLLQGAMQRYRVQPDVEQLDRVLAECRRTLILQIWDRMPQDVKDAAPLPSR